MIALLPREPIMSWCEDNEVFYFFGLARNERLSGQLQGGLESLQNQINDGKLQSPCRNFTEFEYSTLKTWCKGRRVIGKAEILPKGNCDCGFRPLRPF
ncbi:MAG: transposase [Verrucomicrobia bacterium]|nr:transposase [Verrucomicrobiota bacterium]